MNVADALHQLLKLETELAEINEERDKLREFLKRAALEQLDSAGAAPRWALRGVGTVALVVPQPTRKVVNDKEFTAWVVRNYPEKLRSVPDRMWTAQLLTKAEWDFCLVDADTGVAIEGASEVPRPAYLTVRLAKTP